MKIIDYIFVIIISFCGLSVSAQKVDTLHFSTAKAQKHIPYETKSIEELSFDNETYKLLKNDKNYDYYYQKPERSLQDIITEALHKWLSKNINSNIKMEHFRVILWIVTAIVFITILMILYFYKPSLFYLDRKKKYAFETEDENIYSTDFEKLIKESSDSGRYSDAIRWTYLLALRELHKRELVSWDFNKTVNEYVYELKRTDLKSDFKELSHRFLYYRYGNFEATQDAFSSFSLLSDKIIKRL